MKDTSGRPPGEGPCPQPDLAVVDVETTGFVPEKHDRVVEIGIVRTDFQGREQARFETLVNPGRDVGPTHVHGITAEMVKQAPPFEAVADAVLEFLQGSYLVAHNAPFDVRFLKAELERTGDRIEQVPYHCTLQASRRLYPDLPSKKLERLCEYLDIELEQAHSALSDAEATRQLLAILRQERPDLISRSREPFDPGRRVRGVNVEPLSRSQFERSRDETSSPLRRLLARLPTAEPDREGVEAYANLLDEVLLDRLITDEELESVHSVAEDYGISPQVAEEVHLEYLENLVRYALLDDTVTDRERSDLEKVQRLLGLQNRDLDSMIEQARERLDTTYGHADGEVDEDLRGQSVCFTGSLTARIDGEKVSRKKAQRLADERGLTVKKSVTKKLDYLVAADPHTQSNKANKARRYDIPIVAEMEFWRKLRVAVE